MTSIKVNSSYLMQVFGKIIQPPYKDWKIGMSEISHPKTETSAALFVNVRDEEATKEAFLHFVMLGATPVRIVGRKPRYLYAYKVGLKEMPDMY